VRQQQCKICGSCEPVTLVPKMFMRVEDSESGCRIAQSSPNAVVAPRWTDRTEGRSCCPLLSVVVGMITLIVSVITQMDHSPHLEQETAANPDPPIVASTQPVEPPNRTPVRRLVELCWTTRPNTPFPLSDNDCLPAANHSDTAMPYTNQCFARFESIPMKD
jgi:hypothetical protein